MDSPKHEQQTPHDSSEAIRTAAKVASSWLLAMVVLPTGGLLWQLGLVQHLGHWLLAHVFGQLDLTGLFV